MHTGDISAFIRKSILTFRLARGRQHQGAAAARSHRSFPGTGKQEPAEEIKPRRLSHLTLSEQGDWKSSHLYHIQKGVGFRVLRVQHNDLELK